MRRLAACFGVLLLMVGGASGCGRHEHPRLSVRAAGPLIDQPLHITASALRPGESVTLQARTTLWGYDEVWSSKATFVADSHGKLDLDRDEPKSGPFHYTVADSTALLWTMSSDNHLRASGTVPSRAQIHVTMRRRGTVLTRRSIVRRAASSSLRARRLTVSRDGVHGTFFRTASDTRKPAVLLFGGSEGGEHLDLLARMLAVHGYPALSIAYFGAPGLPSTLRRVPVEYGGRALRYLARQSGVDRGRIVTMGLSRGGELAELLGVHYPGLVHGVIALTPANVAVATPGAATPAWTWRGKPVPFAPFINILSPPPASVIPVERIHGPVLASCAGRDEVWRSCMYTKALMSRLRHHHHGYRDRLLTFQDAGHHSNGVLPYQPMNWDPFAEADEAAREREWPVILHWLDALPGGER